MLSADSANVPQLYLTSNKVDRVRHGETPIPRGPTHLKIPGEGTTLCGVPALNWPFLWNLPWVADPRSEMLLTCRACHDAGRMGDRVGRLA